MIENIYRELVNKYILKDDSVLELGCKCHIMSCAINDNLNNKSNHLVVEPDEKVCAILENIREKNNYYFQILNGLISRKKIDIINFENWDRNYGSGYVENENTKIPSYSFNEIKEKYNLNFNVLYIDCKELLDFFIEENQYFFTNFRLIIFNKDYEKYDYDNIENILHNSGFRNIIDISLSLWIKSNVNIQYRLIHCAEHTEREHYTHIIRETLGLPIQLFDGIYTKNVDLSNQLEYIKNFNHNFNFDENRKFYFYRSGQIGCYLSHFKIIEEILENNYNNLFVNDYSVIFEDDVSFENNLNDKIEKIINELEICNVDFDVLFLGNYNDNHREHVINNIYRIDVDNKCWGTHALLIKNKNIKKIFNVLLNICHEIDSQYLISAKENLLNVLTIFPNICMQNYSFPSNINELGD